MQQKTDSGKHSWQPSLVVDTLERTHTRSGPSLHRFHNLLSDIGNFVSYNKNMQVFIP